MITIVKDVEVEVDVELCDFEDEELLEELENRGITANENMRAKIEKIWELRRNSEHYDHILDELIYDTIGKVI
jgi:hypothetical protein